MRRRTRNATGGGRFAYSLGVFGSALTEEEIAARFDFYGEVPADLGTAG